MKEDIGMCSQPRIVPFMDAVIIQDYMHFFVGLEFRHHLVHELQKLNTTFKFCGLRVNGAGSHFQGSKEIQGSMPLVRTLESSDDLPAGRFYITSSSLQRLHAWLLVHRYHEGILRWVQIKANDIRRLGSKFRIRAHTPTSLADQTDPFFPQEPPYGMNRGT